MKKFKSGILVLAMLIGIMSAFTTKTKLPAIKGGLTLTWETVNPDGTRESDPATYMGTSKSAAATALGCDNVNQIYCARVFDTHGNPIVADDIFKTGTLK